VDPTVFKGIDSKFMDITKEAEDALRVSLDSLKNTMKIAKDKLQSLCLKLLNSKD